MCSRVAWRLAQTVLFEHADVAVDLDKKDAGPGSEKDRNSAPLETLS